jgi:hypothetical protein
MLSPEWSSKTKTEIEARSVGDTEHLEKIFKAFMGLRW